MMAINRYRLRHLAKSGHRAARRVSKLLQRPDRLIGLILLGNNFVNLLAASIATVIATTLLGPRGLALATGLLTVVILIFAEVAPKTLAALHPERIAFPASLIIKPMLRIFYPLVWLTNSIANRLLRLIGVSLERQAKARLNREELRGVLLEAEGMIPRRHHSMLLSIFEIESAKVEDVMIPRNDIVGIDINEPWKDILNQLTTSQHTRLPVYQDNIDKVVGVLHVKHVMHQMAHGDISKESLLGAVREAYFAPVGTPLSKQLLNFQKQKKRIALLVDEYGDIQGLITLEDILEEIVGEFTTDTYTTIKEVHPQDDGTYLVDGSANIRDLNRAMQWSLPTDGPKTLNGLIIEYLETIPEPGTSLRLEGYPVEIVQTGSNTIKKVKINPAARTIKKPVEPEQESGLD